MAINLDPRSHSTFVLFILFYKSHCSFIKTWNKLAMYFPLVVRSAKKQICFVPLSASPRYIIIFIFIVIIIFRRLSLSSRTYSVSLPVICSSLSFPFLLTCLSFLPVYPSYLSIPSPVFPLTQEDRRGSSPLQQCGICYKKFKTMKYLNAHLIRKHAEKV